MKKAQKQNHTCFTMSNRYSVRRFLSLLSLSLMLLVVTLQGYALADSAVSDARKGVVRILTAVSCGDSVAISTGTGFCVSKTGNETYFVTNKHVVDTDEIVQEIMWNFPGMPYNIEHQIITDNDVYSVNPSDIITSNKEDLAVIKLHKNIEDRNVLPFAFSSDVPVTSNVSAIGFPGIADNDMSSWYSEEMIESYHKSSGIQYMTISKGTIQRKTKVLGYDHIQHDAELFPGNSGGPLITDQGFVIGVNTWIRLSDGVSSQLEYAIDADVVKNFLAREKISYTEKRTLPEGISPVIFVAVPAIIILIALLGLRYLKAQKKKLLNEVAETAHSSSSKTTATRHETLSDVLRKIYSSADAEKILKNPDYFMGLLANNYQPEFKSDCQILEKSARSGIGQIILQFYQQHAIPTESEKRQIVQQLCDRCGFDISDAARAMTLYWDMVGWGAHIPDSTSPAASVSEHNSSHDYSTRNATKEDTRTPTIPLGEELNRLYRSSDKIRMLTDTDYFISQLTQIYRQEYKTDCKLLDKASHCGLGLIIHQYLQQGTKPSTHEVEQLTSEVCKRCGFTQEESWQAIKLYGQMVGW